MASEDIIWGNYWSRLICPAVLYAINDKIVISDDRKTSSIVCPQMTEPADYVCLQMTKQLIISALR